LIRTDVRDDQIPSPTHTHNTIPDFKCLIREKNTRFSLISSLVIAGSACSIRCVLSKMHRRETPSQVLRAQTCPSPHEDMYNLRRDVSQVYAPSLSIAGSAREVLPNAFSSLSPLFFPSYLSSQCTTARISTQYASPQWLHAVIRLAKIENLPHLQNIARRDSLIQLGCDALKVRDIFL
jgi:hypothetical protein